VARGVPILGAGGVVHEWVGTLTEVIQYRLLEEQLRRAQKLEAIGRLAGGIAHERLVGDEAGDLGVGVEELPDGAVG
jgi:hypothetical protein